MARNVEKSMAVLNRWLTVKSNIVKGATVRRPRDTSDCLDVMEAERWRGQVIREITKKISEIQNASLGEHVIRDLNDQINRLLRERYRWEIRISELGGSDYRVKVDSTSAGKLIDRAGFELSSQAGYKYFGAAKDLPGIRELFFKDTTPVTKRTRQQLYQGINPDYYGWRDEDDPDLLKAERSKEEENTSEERRKYDLEIREKRRKLEGAFNKLNDDNNGDKDSLKEEIDRSQLKDDGDKIDNLKASTTIDKEVIASELKELIAKKKKETLLSVYASHELRNELEESKKLLQKSAKET